MAARKNKVTLSDNWKDGIRASVLMRRLYDNSLGSVEMTNQQIKSAQIVLSKLIPDLARTEMTGEDGGPVRVSGITINLKKPNES
ncbi:MAG: hypothetical protein ACO222_06145 [Polynucleobacter sp.]